MTIPMPPLYRFLVAVAALLPAAASANVEPPTDGPARAVLIHVPPARAQAGEPIDLHAAIDAPYAEVLIVHWRPIGDASWRDAVFERSSDAGWVARIPASREPGVEYYVEGRSGDGVSFLHFASAAAPHRIQIDPSIEERLERLDEARLHGRRNQIGIDVDGHDFGNRYGHKDRFLRGETRLTHRVGGLLYDISFGFGLLEGATPSLRAPDADSLDRGLRYGFASVRLRAKPNVFVDARAALGVSHLGFAPGAAGQVILGRPWRSSVSAGAEWLADLGASAWLRLQWDTAAPFLMGASIVKSDLPGVVIDVSGLYLRYDVAYKLGDRFTLRAAVSYGSRDGAARVGGGLGAAVDF